jgi:hypothetical protein
MRWVSWESPLSSNILVLVRAIVLPFRSSQPMMENGECALPVPTRGGTPTLAYRSKRTGRRGRINAP